jgi:RNA recognition motif-containing protein
LFSIFSSAGIIKSLSIVKKYDSQESKGVAFITYDTIENAENAIKFFNNHGLNNLLLKVDFINSN